MMELFSTNSSAVQNRMESNKAANANNTNGHDKTAQHLIIDSVPPWDMSLAIGGFASMASTNELPPRNGLFFDNFLGALESSTHDFNGIGTAWPNLNHDTKLSSESSNNSSISCSLCDVNASTRCLECNEFMCNGCLRGHRNSPLSSNHSIVSLPTPIGTSPTGGMPASTMSLPSPNYICEQHNEILRYVCEHCMTLVCQGCTFNEHKDHNYTSIESFASDAKEKIDLGINSSRLGDKCIRSNIDKTLTYARLTERNCNELSDEIRKAFRQFISAIEERERFLLDQVEKLRQRRLGILHDEMAGLKSALSGLAETADALLKLAKNTACMYNIDVAMKVTKAQRQLQQFAAINKDLQPKQEMFAFVSPDYNILRDIQRQGVVVVVDEKNMPVTTTGAVVAGFAGDLGLGLPIPSTSVSVTPVPVATNLRLPLIRENSFNNVATHQLLPVNGNGVAAVHSTAIEWEPNNLHSSPARSTRAIPGCTERVRVRNSNTLSLSFATEGHEDGQVSRPWGLCVDKMGSIFVSDRRNNRVQIFNPDGTLKFKFGRKGVGNGEFDLPAGICVDIDNRIIVVDKDNHRVQIFSSTGAFLLKFGIYGKEYGQFQYPWDVAVNSRRQIVVTDSRNHRIQQFDSEGRFIRQIVFDNHGQNKGIASPRGVCYTPDGKIIVSDFDNHCLYLIDPDINEILAAKGHEGSGVREFNRPSGICCDDEGCIIVADSKNHRIIVYGPSLEYLWSIAIRPSVNPFMPATLGEKDRTCDVALMPDGRIVFLIELSPDSKEGSNPYKRFIHAF